MRWLRPYAATVFPFLVALVLCSELLSAGNWRERTVVSDLNGERSSTLLRRSSSMTGHGMVPAQRAVSEKDAITMRLISGPGANSNYGGTLTRDFAIFSPDGSKFVITLKRGNLRNNRNDYTLLLYHTDQIFRSREPVVLVSLSSSSNREAIKDVSW